MSLVAPTALPHAAAAGVPVSHAGAPCGLIRVAGGKWALWDLACLRGAGFPAEHVLALSSPALARLAVQLLQTRGHDARAGVRAAYAAERLRIRSVLRDIAGSESFREAVVWQNRRAFRYAVAPLAAAPVEQLDSEMRKKELLVASYVQRYCVKNETIGFFGPVGWARWSDAQADTTVACGPALVAGRQVYFESWSIDALARALDGRPALRPWRIPRVPAFVRLEGARVSLGTRVVAELSPDHARLFAACDGSRHARAIALELCATRPLSFPTEAAVYDVLEGWLRAGHLTWSFEGPRELNPERTLRERLAAIDDPLLRDAALADVDGIERARRAVAMAAGDARALDGALDALEEKFSCIAGVAPTRAQGEMYAARTLVYEDCRRDVAVRLGADVLRRLGPPLSLILQSARWAVHELARRHAREFRRVYDTLAAGGRRTVTLGSFFARTSLVGDTRGALSPVAAAVRADLQQRWAEVLGASPAAHRIRFRSRDLRPAVAAAFDTPTDPPSSWARYLSPDIMIDAPGVDAIARGEYRIVLGELHVINTLAQSAFMTQCPDPEAVVQALDRDCAGPRVYWLAPKDAAPQRVQYTRKPNDYVYVASRDPSPAPPGRTLRVADLVVADAGGTLVVQARDGSVCFSCDEFFGYLMMRKEVNLFSPLAAATHRPRVTIDDVVVCREQWQVPAGELTFASRGDDVERFVECLRWTHTRGIPRFAFVKLSTERKPIYVDLFSPLFVDLLARALRIVQRKDPASLVTITEMLPAPDGAWLVDGRGRRYTSELRVVALDPSVAKELRGA